MPQSMLGCTPGLPHPEMGGGLATSCLVQDGKYLKKMATFTDFVACAEHLVALGYTSSQRLCIEGRSAGGLTMGAVLNLRPDLFHAAILGALSCGSLGFRGLGFMVPWVRLGSN